MLTDLKVLNGNLELKFDQYTYEYTVVVDDSTTSLELEYSLTEDTFIKVIDNDLDSYENIVYLDVYTLDSSLLYTLYVYKENTENVNLIDNYRSSLEVNPEEVNNFVEVELLGVSIFLLILLTFTLLFRKKRIKK